MDFLPEPFRTILAFVVVLGVLIFVHELGHYLAARWRGVHVERFSIGFGRAIASWNDRRGCEWRVGWIPLGGYVKMHGMEHAADTPPEPGSFRAGESFHEKSVGDRAIIVFAGPAFNFLLAAVVFAVLFATVGRPVGSTAVQSVVAGSAAERAGLVPGDRILALDGERVLRFEDLQRHIQPRAGQPVEVLVRRGESEVKLIATPAAREDGRGVLGIAGGAVERERLDPFSAVLYGSWHMVVVSGQTLAGVWQMITGSRGAEEIGGPLRIAQLSGEVADMGILPLLTFIALLSINLALINLFPIPILDGGHLVFYAAEAIRGRPLTARAQEYAFRGGFALLVTLMLLATWNDLTQLGVVRWVAGLVG
ncbi:RIP metalloprotease RseP [Roseomonas alkaliterrae]|uniref:Zinc metalloprotease n=1 Tax=Neoroseomonas alkaliterrae TaxID=1452450 RepID=A0A840XRJ5_9PROT|nr:RIP metalloprotease RseP [Neoroseomonas alkaliterrae]MBB5689540.1 regulator of sigma E protease [Neoroseomonas alkaliterrae]MBR0676626.1 RIP metalloprotease RseP [Neoroseomonas alkaliterrae]